MSKIMNNIKALSLQMNRNGMNKKTIISLISNINKIKLEKK
jgi:hypothetical protein